jgi:type II secretory pathway component PulF
MKNNSDKILKFRFGTAHRISMYKRLKSYIEEEFAVYESLVKFKTRFDKKKDYRGKIIAIWLEKMNHGVSFSNAIAGWVPDSELNLISAGEEGQGLDKGLSEAIKFSLSGKEIKAAVIGGISYPAILLLVVLGFVSMFSLQMAPAYLGILPLERWPDMGQYLYAVSTFLVKYWYVIFGILAVLGVAIGSTISFWRGNVRELADKIPPWSVYKVYHSSSFLIALASMMQSGVPLNDALKKLKKTSSVWLGAYIEEMMKNLRRGGKNFGQHLNVGLLDEETAGDVIDYSELGKFEQAVYSIGEENLKNSVVKIQSRMGLVRNLMIVLVGITVGVIYYTNIELNGTVADSASSSTTSMIQKTK